MCAGMSAGTGRASGVGLVAITCATVHFLIAVLRRRVATVDLARLVSCVACPSDRLELHLDIEGAEYEVCQVPSLFAVHTHTDYGFTQRGRLLLFAPSYLRERACYYGRCCATCLPAALHAASAR